MHCYDLVKLRTSRKLSEIDANANGSSTHAQAASVKQFHKNDRVRVRWGCKWHTAMIDTYFSNTNEYDVVFDSDGSVAKIEISKISK